MIGNMAKQRVRIALGMTLCAAAFSASAMAASEAEPVALLVRGEPMVLNVSGAHDSLGVKNDTVSSMEQGLATSKKDSLTRVIKAYEEPVTHGQVSLTHPRSTQYKDITLRILFPMNDPKDYGKMPQYDGFPKEIPQFAKDVQMYYVPQFLKTGAVGEVSFSGTATELAPYIKEAKALAIDTMTLGDSGHVYIQLEPVYNMASALSAKDLVLGYEIRRTSELKNLGTVPEFVPELAERMDIKVDNQVNSVALSEKENKRLQKKLLGYYSYGFNSIPVPDDYTLYVFNVGGVPDH